MGFLSLSDKLPEAHDRDLTIIGPKDDLVVSAICTCLVCDIRTHKRLEQPIALADFEKYRTNLLCQLCSTIFGSVIPEMDFEMQCRGKNDNKSNEKEKRPTYVQKYSNHGHLAEAVIANGLPYFLQIIDGKPQLLESIRLADINLVPLDKVSYINKEYSFESLEEITKYVERAKNENYGSLYRKSKSIWAKYIDADKDHLTICAADTIFTYFQDKFGMTHYLIFVGDNNTGKSNNLKVFQYLGYRSLFDTSITAANIHQFLGSVEEGQGILLEDEADNIDEDKEKMKIYKVGYQSGTKVTRIQDVKGNRKQLSHWTYCFKAYSTERLPGIVKAKGFNERCFIIQCSTGKPGHDITEVINPAGDDKQSKLLAELLDHRKLLLVFRIMHYNEPFPDIPLNIKNRDKQLCKPLIRLFQKSDCLDEIIPTLSKLIADKRKRKNESLDARLYSIIQSLVKEKGTILSNQEIWDAVKANIERYVHTENTYQTEEFYEISKKKVTTILKDKFGARTCHCGVDGKERGLRFNQTTLNKLGDNYDALEDIQIISDTSDTSDTSGEYGSQIIPTVGKSVEHKLGRVDSREGTKHMDLLQVKPSEPSEPSETKHSIQRAYPHSDLWICEFCNVKADKHHFTRSSCTGRKKK